MALTISTGFVVDDAIVVIENVTRHLEQGMRPLEAALQGAQEIGFTVLSISISLVAVFMPILLMGGIVGRLFREFAVTLSTADSRFARRFVDHDADDVRAGFSSTSARKITGRLYRASEEVFGWILRLYEHSLHGCCAIAALTLGVLLLTIGVNVYLLIIVPKGFFPQQDTGRIVGGIQGVQDTSFQAMRQRITRFVDIIRADPAVANVMAFTGSGAGTTTNTGRVFMALKPLEERKVSADQLINRLRPKLATVPGAAVFLQGGRTCASAARLGNAQYQYTIQSDNLEDLTRMGADSPATDDGSSRPDGRQQRSAEQRPSGVTRLRPRDGSETRNHAADDRRHALRCVWTTAGFDDVHAVESVSRCDGGGARVLAKPGRTETDLRRAANGGVVPLSAFAHYEPTTAPLAVNHQGQFPSVTLSFNLAPGVALSDAVKPINQTGTEYRDAGDDSRKLLRDGAGVSGVACELSPF